VSGKRFLVVKVNNFTLFLLYCMSIPQRLRNLREDWRRIISVAKKPEKSTLYQSIKLTLLVMGVIGIIAYIIQLTVALLLH